MAIAYLNTGSVSLAAANWSDATGVDDDATLVIGNGSQAVTAGLNRAGDTSTGVDYLHITAGFTGRIGSVSAGSAIIEMDATYTTNPNLLITGGVEVWYSCAATTCTAAVIDMPGVVYLTGGTYTTLRVRRGSVIVQAAATVTNLIVSEGGSVTLNAGGTAPTLIELQSGGTVYSGRNATTVDNAGGLFTGEFGGTTVGTLNNRSGARSNIQGGTITTANCDAGSILDLGTVVRAITISTLNREGNAIVFGRDHPQVTISAEAAPGLGDLGSGGG